jgi:predicted permease
VLSGAIRRFADQTRQDLRYAVRTLARSRTYTATVVLTLGVGLGATATVFAVVDHVVLRPLPYPDPGRLVSVREIIVQMEKQYPTMPVNAHDFTEWRRSIRSLTGLSAIFPWPMTLVTSGQAQRIHGARVSATVFPLLGASAERGRLLSAEDDAYGRNCVVDISDPFWRRQFGGDPQIVGRTVTVDDRPCTIVGVLPASFRLLSDAGVAAFRSKLVAPDLLEPIAFTPQQLATEGEHNYTVLARLVPGASVAQAVRELDVVEAAISAQSKDGISLRSAVLPLTGQVVGHVRLALVLLLGAALAMLLIIAANLANLALARAIGRMGESAVRLAVGATRGRLIRQTLTEGITLGVVGGACGVALALIGLPLLLASAPSTLPRLDEVRLDIQGLTVILLLAIAAGLVIGALPAWKIARGDLGQHLTSEARGGAGGREARHRRFWFIGGESALCSVLSVTTALLLISFVHVLHVDEGFSPEHVLAADVALPQSRYPTRESRARFYDRVLPELAVIPGVRSAAATTWLPLLGDEQVDNLSYENDSRPYAERPPVDIRYVSPEYFATVGTPLRRGRLFTDLDRSRHVVVLSERAAQAMWPGQDPIGRMVVPGSNDTTAEVIGVVEDVHTSSAEEEGHPVAYIPMWQILMAEGSVLVRSAGDPARLASAVRAAVIRVDPLVPVANVRTMSEIVSEAVAARRFQLDVLALFALMAVATAAIGIFGVIAHSLAARTREIGIRMALGANAGGVRLLVLREHMGPVVAGIAIGLGAALAFGRILRALLFEVQPGDPVAYAIVATTIGAVAAVACAIPAWRATASDPIRMLR